MRIVRQSRFLDRWRVDGGQEVMTARAPVAERKVTSRANPVSALGARPAVAAVQLRAAGDGVAYVARLIYRALAAGVGHPPALVELAHGGSSAVGRVERLRFLARLSAVQIAQADWVCFTHVGLARAQRWVPTMIRRPYAVFLHGIEAWDPLLPPGRRAAMRDARVRIANSSFTAARVASAHPGLGAIAVCPLALDPSDTARNTSADATASANDDGPSVVIIGRMNAAERYKGHDQLIECWPAVLRAVPTARLVIVGSGDDGDRLKHKAAATGTNDRIHFTGFVSDAQRDALLATAAVFAMPSKGEGFGIVYLQAMRAGVPCLGSRDDAAGDLIVDGVTGVLVDPDDIAALGAHLVRLLLNESLRRRMGEAGRLRHAAEFSFERFQDRLLAALSPAPSALGRVT